MNDTSNTVCHFCKYDFEIEDADFCPECGNPLHNYCTNDDCELNNTELYDEIFEVPFNSKYCYKCGAKTTLHDLLISVENQNDNHTIDNN